MSAEAFNAPGWLVSEQARLRPADCSAHELASWAATVDGLTTRTRVDLMVLALGGGPDEADEAWDVFDSHVSAGTPAAESFGHAALYLIEAER